MFVRKNQRHQSVDIVVAPVPRHEINPPREHNAARLTSY